MNKFLTIYLILFSSALSSAQNLDWYHSISNSTNSTAALSIKLIKDSIQLAGYSNGTMDYDPGPNTSNFSGAGYIASYDTNAKPLRTSFLNTVQNNSFYQSYDKDAFGNFIVCNTSRVYYNGKLQIVNSGDSAEFRKVALDNLGNYYISGLFYGKTDVGNSKGSHFIYPSTGFKKPKNSSGRFKVIDAFIAKYSSDGKLVFVKTFDVNEELFAFNDGASSSWNIYAEWKKDFAIDKEGNLIVFSPFQETVNIDPGFTNKTYTTSSTALFIAKYSAQGNYIWSEIYHGEKFPDDAVYNIAINKTNDDIYLYFNDDKANSAVYRLNKYGELKNKSFFKGNLDSDYHNTDNIKYGKLYVADNGDVYISGRTYQIDFMPDVCPTNRTSIKSTCYPTLCFKTIIAKFTSEMDFLWFQEIPPTLGTPYVLDITANSKGIVYFCGVSNPSYNCCSKTIFGKISPPNAEIRQFSCGTPPLSYESIKEVCKGGTIKLIGESLSPIYWYNSLCSLQPIETNSTFTTNKLVGDSIFYMAYASCPEFRFAVKVKLSNSGTPIYDNAIPDTICKGDSIKLSAFTYNKDSVYWTGGIRNGSYIRLDSNRTFNAYTFPDKQNCTGSLTKIIRVVEPKVNITNLTPNACKGEDIMLLLEKNDIKLQNGYYFNAQQKSDTLIFKAEAKEYNLNFKAGNCVLNKIFKTNVHEFSNSINNQQVACTEKPLNIEAKGVGLDFKWNPNIINGSKAYFNSNTTLILTSKSSSCTEVDTFNITTYKTPKLSILNTARCQNDTINFKLNDGFGINMQEDRIKGAFHFAFPDSGFFLVPTSSDFRLWAIGDYYSCTSDTFKVILGGPKTELPFATDYNPLCIGDSLTFLATGNSEYFKWSDGIVNGQRVLPENEKSYTLETKLNGCVGKQEIFFRTYPGPEIKFSAVPACTEDFVSYQVTGPWLNISLWKSEKDNIDIPAYGYLPNMAGNYRIEAFNSDCRTSKKFTLKDCLITGVNELTDNFANSIFPNPANKGDKINFHVNQDEFDIQLTDLEGTTIYSGKKKRNEDMILPEIGSGVFMIEIKNSAFSMREKLVVQ